MFDHQVVNSFLVPSYSLGEAMACLNNFCVLMSVITGAFDFPFGSFCFGGLGVSFSGGGRGPAKLSQNVYHLS